MKTIHDITYDRNLYSQFDPLIVLLYQIKGTSLAIPCSTADLIGFVDVFDKILTCREHICKNDGRTFTLFAYSENMETWLLDNKPIPDNVEDITVFCPCNNDKEFFKRWIRRYTQKMNMTVTYDKLEREILLFGIRYIDDLCSGFEENNAVRRLLNEDREKLCSALKNCFDNAVDRQDQYIKQSVEISHS